MVRGDFCQDLQAHMSIVFFCWGERLDFSRDDSGE